MMPIEAKSRIPRSLLTIINNIPVINNCQQTLATKTPNRAQLAMISHLALSFDASCTPFGLNNKNLYGFIFGVSRHSVLWIFLIKTVRR